VVHPETSLGEAAALMREKNVLCAAVYDNQRQEFVGKVDLFELMTATAMNFFEEQEYSDEIAEKHFHQWRFDCSSIRDLMAKYPCISKVCIFNANQQLKEALIVLADREHRILVKHNNKCYVINREDILRQYNFSLLPKKSLEDMGLLRNKKQIISISTQDKVAKGLFLMHKHQISAVAIMDRLGNLVDVLSISSLRGFNKEMLLKIRLPVHQFLVNKNPPLIIHAKDSFKSAVTKITENDIGRLWVIDSRCVLTLTDILSAMVALQSY